MRVVAATGGAAFAPPDTGFRITQVAWFGYDAVIDGDELVVIYDEETVDAWYICVGAPFFADGGALDAFEANAAAGHTSAILGGTSQTVSDIFGTAY